VTCRGLPSVRAWAVFFLALCSSRHTVPLETPIFAPASSWDKPSRSTSLRASISAGSIRMGTGFDCGVGEKVLACGGCGRLIGFGCRPLLPCLCLQPIVVRLFVFAA
jgi:hypothetical protein